MRHLLAHTARIFRLAFLLTTCILVSRVFAQAPGTGTRNLQTASHMAAEDLSSLGELSTIAFDQASDRPLIYVGGHSAWAVVDISDASKPELIQSLSTEGAVSDVTHFQLAGKTFAAVASGERVDVFDVSDVSRKKTPVTVGSISVDAPATLFAYRHSKGGTLLIVTAGGDALLYDAAATAKGTPKLLGSIATPPLPDPNDKGYERAFAAFHAASETDRFYGAGAGGYHVFDISRPDSAVYLTSATPAAIRRGHMVSVTPDGRYLLAGAGYRAAPLRIFDLEPALDGKLPVMRTSFGAWTDDWTSFLLAHEMRWPLVFVASGEQGLQVFDMRDPGAPFTYAYFRTSSAPAGSIDDRVQDVNGAVDVDVRNSDGLIAVADRQTGLWLFRLEAFQGWDGRGYGLPNISSVQNWKDGPSPKTSF